MEQISKAIKEKDFDTFAKITMADSNQFHAVALDTEPPIFYMNDVSRALIAIIVELNRVSVARTGHLAAAYTYDAGPNCVIYAPEANMKEIIQLVVKFFPQPSGFNDRLGVFGAEGAGEGKLPEGFEEKVAAKFGPGAVKTLIHTRVGDGPRKLGEEESLLGSDGTPKSLA
jgi:diphosphomevalonate decarboxylase